ncbi:hypothetical protein AM588_10001612 [Phytophthora nicotianae]|uniref:Uncharacterized protein n=1 Tax=Phytophthora nicotianae TaxID=4792 RepID=A0A0W8CUR9_PHYNI|nr:hypothetical protein AM588_10001612 [Phytophthora nicotianae]
MADSLYLSKTDYRLSYISGITMGQASPLSALVTDANRNIADIGELSCTSLKLNGSTVNLSKLDLLSATPGTASSGKALITDGSNSLTDLSSLIIRGSNSSKALAIQNDTAASSASMNFVSYYQAEVGVRGSSNASNPNCFFIRYGNADRVLIDSSGNMSIGGAINSLYKLDISGGLNATSLYVNGSAADLSKLSLLSATPGTASASKALITDSLNNLTDLYTLTIKGSNTNKSLIIQNDTTSSSASLNIVSFYQMEQGVRGSANASNPNCYFWRFANSDRLLMDSSGNIAIGGSINPAYKVNITGALNATSLYVNGSLADLTKLPLLSTTAGIASPSKALITDSVNALSDLYSLTIKGSNSGKSLIIQNDVTTSAASMNFVSYFQCEVGVRGSSHATTPNCFFIRYGNSDRILMDSSGNVSIGGPVNTAYKLDINGSLNCASLTVAGSAITAASNVYSVTAGTTLSASNACDKYNLILRNASTSSSTVNGIAFLSETDTAYSSLTPSAAIVASRVSSSTYAASALAFYTKFSSNASQTGSLSRRLYIDETSISIGNTNGTGDFNILTVLPPF